MTTVPAPPPTSLPVKRRLRRGATPLHPINRIARFIVLLAIAAICLLAVMQNRWVRAAEAYLAGSVLTPFNTKAGARWDVFWFDVPGRGLTAMQVTMECTVLIIAIPLLLTAGVILATTRVKWVRMGAAIVLMMVTVAAANVLRLAFIGWSTSTWGLKVGYPLAHTFLGSVLGILGFAAGLAVLLIVAGTRPRRRKRTP